MQARSFLPSLFIVAVLIRLAAVIALRDMGEGPSRRLGADGVEYNQLAISVASGEGYCWSDGRATSFRAPGFPFFLAALYAILGINYVAAYASFCLLGGVACLLAYSITRELASEFTARVAAILAVFYGPHIYFAASFDSENLFAVCLGIGIWLFLRYLKHDSWKELLGASLSLGWAALTRPFALLLLPVLAGVLLIHHVRARKFAMAPFMVLIVPFLSIILPWTARNFRVFHQFVLVATNGGSTFYGGNNDIVLNERAHWGAWVSTVYLPGRDLIEAMPDEVSHDKMEWKLGVQWLREHIWAIPRLYLFKIARLWLPDVESPNKKYVWLQLLSYSPFLILFLIGALRCLRDRGSRSLAWMVLDGTIGATLVTALIFWGSPRFRDANICVLMVYAASGLEAIIHWAGHRKAHLTALATL